MCPIVTNRLFHDYFSEARSLLVSATWGSYFPTSPAVGLHQEGTQSFSFGATKFRVC